uniref:BPTI/Kunitz inhibitor domain-containing protein n=1 Tax=Syphacia muris TaxID=451379 RepID=A0A0N5ATU5_9BILA
MLCWTHAGIILQAFATFYQGSGLKIRQQFVSSLSLRMNCVFGQRPGAPFSICSQPKDNGYYCDSMTKNDEQNFYYDPAWRLCFAFRYKGCGGNENRFSSRNDCERRCLFSDGSACKADKSVKPLNEAMHCGEAICPEGYECAFSFFPECCNATLQKIPEQVREALAEKCPDGSSASGVKKLYFIATFGKTCDDLLCKNGEKCVQGDRGEDCLVCMGCVNVRIHVGSRIVDFHTLVIAIGDRHRRHRYN